LKAQGPPLDPVLAKVLNLGNAANSNGGLYGRLREIRQDLDGVSDPLERETIRTEIERQLKASGVEPARAAALAVAVLKPEPRGGEPAPNPAITPMNAADLDLPRITGLAWKALMAANDPPTIFCAGGPLVRLEKPPAAPACLRSLNEDRLRHHLARAVPWTAPTKEGARSALPPMHVVKDMLADPLPPAPQAPRIVGAPAFSSRGELLTEPGYHPATAVYYVPAPGLVIPPIPETPSENDIARATAVLCDELLCDFPFTGDAERAHALAFLLLPFLRDLINGPTPLHLFEKPSPGTGASLLVEVLALPALGRSPAVMTAGRDEDEWRKRITANLTSGASVMLIDNVGRRLDSDALSSAITAAEWTDRLLGSTQMLVIPVRCAWAATANNARLSNELARRTVRCRLDARMDRPWGRTGFKHPLPEWAAQTRGELIKAALTSIQAWLRRGRPESPAVLGGFESWSRVVGGVLRVMGVAGFLANVEEVYELSDVEGAENRRFVAVWWKTHGPAEVGVSELFTLALSDEVGLDLSSKTERGQRTQLGHRVASMRDRRYTVAAGEGEGRRERTLRVSLAGAQQGAGRWKLALEPAKGSQGSLRSETDERSNTSEVNLRFTQGSLSLQGSPTTSAPREGDSDVLNGESADSTARPGEPCEPVTSPSAGTVEGPDEVII